MYLYRYVFYNYASSADDSTFSFFPNVNIILQEYEIEKETEKGFWIDARHGKNKWVSKKGKKRFAYPTKEQALENLKKRTERRIKLLQNEIDICESALGEIGKVDTSEDDAVAIHYLLDANKPKGSVAE